MPGINIDESPVWRLDLAADEDPWAGVQADGPDDGGWDPITYVLCHGHSTGSYGQEQIISALRSPLLVSNVSTTKIKMFATERVLSNLELPTTST